MPCFAAEFVRVAPPRKTSVPLFPHCRGHCPMRALSALPFSPPLRRVWQTPILTSNIRSKCLKTEIGFHPTRV